MDDKDDMKKEERKFLKRKNPPAYEFMLEDLLKWPSHTVEWLPIKTEFEQYSVQKLILGTDTSSNETNCLIIGDVKIYRDDYELDPQELDHDGNLQREKKEIFPKGELTISQRINHEGVVNRARHMPQKQSIIATKTNDPDILMFDAEKHPSEPVDNECNPEYRLKGHVEEGYGLSWSALKQGHLLSCTYDGEIGLWDVNAKPENKSIDVCLLFKAHKGAVRDVAWHMKNEFTYGSVGVDKYLRIWDTRTKGNNSPAQSVVAHKLAVNSLSFNHMRDELIATGSGDRTVKIFDLRKLDTALHAFAKHEKEVVKVEWSPKNETVLASSCLNSKIMIWDFSRIGMEKLPQEVEGSTPELLATQGHTEKIGDFSLNSEEHFLLASVDDDKTVQVWQMRF